MIDIRSLFVTGSVTLGVIGALLLLVEKARQPAIVPRRLGLAYLLAAVATLLLAARGTIPDRLSIDLANALLLGAYGLIWSAIRAFVGRVTPLAALLLGPAIWLIACQIPAFYASPGARTALLAALGGGYSLAGAWALWRAKLPASLARGIALLLMLANGLLFLARPLIVLLAPLPPTGTALPSSPWFIGLSLASLTHFVGLAFVLVVLAKERAEAMTRESLLAARDAAIEASQAKSRFLTRLTYALRTPLNSVLGLAQSLLRDPRVAEDQRQQLATLERAGQQLLAVANDALELAAVEAGRVQLRATPIELSPFVEDCLALIRPQAAAKRLALTADLRDGLPRAVAADALRLRQVLLSLLSNAVTFTPEDGSVRLRVLPLPQGGLRFEVLDTGPGIPPARQANLFRDFGQGAPGPDPEFGGPGLGLSLAAALVALMRGRIGHEPGEQGLGSCFWVELPLPETAPPATEAEGVQASPRAPPRRILVVDDLAPNRLVARILLEGAGHQVAGVADGAEAVEAVKTGDFDLVLMDIHMPGMDGVEAARRIREWEGPERRLRILAVTADTASDQIARCRAAGMDGHLLKPLDRATLLAAVEDAFRQTDRPA